MDTKQPKFGKIVFECGSCGGKIFHVTENDGVQCNVCKRQLATDLDHLRPPDDTGVVLKVYEIA